ncbi:hypothetical protein ACHAPJ_003025 [Fusarium lateritium]
MSNEDQAEPWPVFHPGPPKGGGDEVVLLRIKEGDVWEREPIQTKALKGAFLQVGGPGEDSYLTKNVVVFLMLGEVSFTLVLEESREVHGDVFGINVTRRSIDEVVGLGFVPAPIATGREKMAVKLVDYTKTCIHLLVQFPGSVSRWSFELREITSIENRPADLCDGFVSVLAPTHKVALRIGVSEDSTKIFEVD